MRRAYLSAILGLSLSTSLGGCAAWMGGQAAGPSTYNVATGPQTLAFDNKIFQTRGEPLPLKEDQLVKVGSAEGFEIFQLKGGGGGGAMANVDMIYIKTEDGRYQSLMRLP